MAFGQIDTINIFIECSRRSSSANVIIFCCFFFFIIIILSYASIRLYHVDVGRIVYSAIFSKNGIANHSHFDEFNLQSVPVSVLSTLHPTTTQELPMKQTEKWILLLVVCRCLDLFVFIFRFHAQCDATTYKHDAHIHTYEAAKQTKLNFCCWRFIERLSIKNKEEEKKIAN